MTSTVEALRATAATPDEQAFGEISGRTQVRISLASGYFHRATPEDLERQFERLAKLLFVARMKQYYRIRSADFGEEIRSEAPPTSREDREYVERRAEIQVTGGAGTLVEVTAIGMEHFSVRIDRDQLRQHDETSLCAAASRAATELATNQFAAVRALKNRIYLGD